MKSPADLSYYGIRPNIIEINSEFSTIQARIRGRINCYQFSTTFLLTVLNSWIVGIHKLPFNKLNCDR